MQNRIILQINKLNNAIHSYNTDYLIDSLNEADRQFCLRIIVLTDILAANNGVLPTIDTIPQYNHYVSLANSYIEILQDELRYLQGVNIGYSRFSSRTINLLYNSQEQFTPNKPLYQSNGKTLTVANVLSVVGYATKVIEMFGVKIDDKYSVALMVLNSIDLALNNRKQDKPLNKALHLTNDVLSEVAKKAIDDEKAGRVVSGMSLLVDLTIDFLVKE